MGVFMRLYLALHVLTTLGLPFAWSTIYTASDQGLTSLPNDIPADTTSLTLSKNELTTINPVQLFHLNLHQLRALDLAENQFSEFPDVCAVGETLVYIRIDAQMVQIDAQMVPLTIPTQRLACLAQLMVFSAGTLLTAFPDFSQNSQLTVISLYHSQVSEVVAAHLQNLPSLWHLNMLNCNLDSFPTLPDLPLLRELYLNVNVLTELPPLGNLPALQLLDLSHNLLSAIPDVCQQSSSMQKLFLSHNPLLALDQTRLDCLTNLKTLFLTQAITFDISSVSLSAMADTLEWLDLSHNQFSILPKFPNMTRLAHFDVSYCTDLVMAGDYFTGQNWSSLTELRLSVSNISRLPDLSPLGPTLQALYLTGSVNNATLDVSSFASLPNVTTLNLDLAAVPGPGFFLPTTCPFHPGALSVSVGAGVDLCLPNNLWLRMVAEAGGSVTATEVQTCGGLPWSTATVTQLLQATAQPSSPEQREKRARATKPGFFCGFPLHSHRPSTSLTRCTHLCLLTPGCYSFNFRPGTTSGDCIIIAPTGGESVNYAPEDLTEWKFYEITD